MPTPFIHHGEHSQTHILDRLTIFAAWLFTAVTAWALPEPAVAADSPAGPNIIYIPADDKYVASTSGGKSRAIMEVSLAMWAAQITSDCHKFRSIYCN